MTAPAAERTERRSVGERHHEMLQADRAGRRRRCADAGPGVQADVMVIAAGGNKSGLGPISLHQFKAEHPAVKVECALEI